MYLTRFMMFCLILTSLFFCSYLSTLLKNQFDHTAEAILPALINLISNSAKVKKIILFLLGTQFTLLCSTDTFLRVIARVDPYRVDLNLCRAKFININ